MVAADVPLGDIEVGSGILGKELFEAVADILAVGLAVLVGAHEIERREKSGVHPLLLKVKIHQSGRHHLPLGQDFLLILLAEAVAA